MSRPIKRMSVSTQITITGMLKQRTHKLLSEYSLGIRYKNMVDINANEGHDKPH